MTREVNGTIRTGYTRIRAHLINGGVMLRETKHLWLFPVGGSLQKRSEIESLASRTLSAALQLRFAQNDSYEAAGSKPNEKRHGQ